MTPQTLPVRHATRDGREALEGLEEVAREGLAVLSEGALGEVWPQLKKVNVIVLLRHRQTTATELYRIH